MSLYIHRSPVIRYNLPSLLSPSFFRRTSSFKMRYLMPCSAKIGNTDFDPESASSIVADTFTSPKAEEWLKILDGFEGTFADVPDVNLDSTKHANAVEENSKVILKYVNAQLVKNGLTQIQFEGLITAAKQKAGTNREGSDQIIALKKILNTGKWKGFMEAVSLKCQDKRNLDQQIPDIGMTPAEYSKASTNATKVSLARSAWGRYTSRKKYIMETPVKDKIANEQEFLLWLGKNSTEVTKILCLTVSDIPVTFDPIAIGEFTAEPTSLENKKKIKAVLVKLQKEAYAAHKKDEAGWKLDPWLETK